MTYTYRCNKCGYQTDALSKYQRNVIKRLHQAHVTCPKGLLFVDDEKPSRRVRVVRAQIADTTFKEMRNG